MPSKPQNPSTKTAISTAASMAATAMVVYSFAKQFIPRELQQYIFAKLQYLVTSFSKDITLVINEYNGLNKNQLFSAAELYVATICSPSVKRFQASLPEKEKKITVLLAGAEAVTDEFHGFKLTWRLAIKQTQLRYSNEYNSSTIHEIKQFELIFHKKYRSIVIDEYLPYVIERSRAVKEEKRMLQLYTLKIEGLRGQMLNLWHSVNLDHPANFETLALDDEIKSMIVDDLDMFLKRREMYRRVGKAWKRGYLLYGPPGTGKSSLIAAMANYLNFDVYDLELTDLRCNSDLRRLLIATANKSILVVEDIDASIDLSKRSKAAAKRPSPHMLEERSKVTLSGLLNFIDGLWSSCGDERIIIFTTNHKDKLDEALLRPGRMDVHIHMSHCTPCGFKMLTSNYLGITEHPLICLAEGLVSSTKVTPAEVGEQLLKSDDPGVALQGLINFLEQKKLVQETKKATITEEESSLESLKRKDKKILVPV